MDAPEGKSRIARRRQPLENVEQAVLSPERATFVGDSLDVAPPGLGILARYRPGIFIPGYTTLPLRGKITNP